MSIQDYKHLFKIINILLAVALLTSCNSIVRYDHKISERDKFYLGVTLTELQAPTDIILPIQNKNYNIPVANENDITEKEVDIFPPTNF